MQSPNLLQEVRAFFIFPTMFFTEIEKYFEGDILKYTPVSGGDINEAFKIETKEKDYFVKTNTIPNALDMFGKEAKGLSVLSKVVSVPEILCVDEIAGTAFLLLEFIKNEIRTSSSTFWEKFGLSIASLHQTSNSKFGLEHSNYIGRLSQSNSEHDKWSDFYTNERLMPQAKLAVDSGRMGISDLKKLNSLCNRLDEICPIEPPALIHGDLWSGNFLCGKGNRPVLIDPSISFSHREMDIAMSRLFGGFDKLFYKVYQGIFPLQPNYEKREEIYQLYYLLVHVNLFGGSYIQSVRNILKRF